MAELDWKDRYRSKIQTAASALKVVKSGDSVFIGTGCGEPQHLVNTLMERAPDLSDTHIIHLLTMGDAPYVQEKFRSKFKMNTFFIADNVRPALEKGIGDYTPIFLSEIPKEFELGRIGLDVALICVTPPDINGLCSLGVSVDIVASAAANARYVIAQVNQEMPWTFGNSYIHVNSIDALVPFDEPLVALDVRPPDETLQRIGTNIARLIEDGSTIECGIGRIPQALGQTLAHKRNLGVHTEMFSDWVIDLIECGAVTGAKKSLNRGKVVASFCMGSKRLYDYINDNPLFEFYPTEYVNDVNVIAEHEKMISINVGLEVDLTGQVCADSLGYRFYSGIGGQVDFIRGAARSRGGKAIIAMPSTARDGEVSRIVPHLAEGAGVVTTRGDVHYVVTEYGIAYLHGKSIRERVLDLISIAHPKFRKELLRSAKEQNYVYKDQIEVWWEAEQYPKQLERYDTLKDGTEIYFRPIKPTDEPALSEMLYSLSRATVHYRYLTQSMTFPHKDVQQLTHVDFQHDMTIVGVVPGPSGEDIVAIAQYFLDPMTLSAEVAFLVQDEWQQKGMGSHLLNTITSIAKGRGVKKFYAKVLPDNKPMLQLFYNSGYAINTEFDGEVYSIDYDLSSNPET